MDEKKAEEKDGLPGFEGSDEFQKEDPFGKVLEEGTFDQEKPAPKDMAPPEAKAPSGGRLGDRAFAVSTALATVILVGGMVFIYAISGGFSPPGTTSEPSAPGPAPAPAPAPAPPPVPRDAELEGLSRGELERHAAELRQELESLRNERIKLQLEVRKWKYRVEEMDEPYLAGVLDRYLNGKVGDAEGARRVLTERGGKLAEALLKLVETLRAREARLREEVRQWKEKSDASMAAVLRLEVKVNELEKKKTLEEAQAFYHQGYRQSEEQAWAKAEASFSRALALDPSLDAAFAGRGLARLSLNRAPEALADFDRALVLNPRSHRFHLHRARALLALDRREEARTACEKALAIDPGFTPALKLQRELQEKPDGR